MKLNSIEILFENCETITIDKKDIEHIAINEIYSNYFYSKYSEETKVKECKEFQLVLNESADVLYSPFDLGGEYECTVFERIMKYNDIVSISLISDKKCKIINLPWDYSNGCENKFQESQIEGDRLFINVKEKK